MDIGVDIVEIDRIRKAVRNRRFLQRVFTPQEVGYCHARKNSGQHFAVRFAAKEAVWKAVGEPKMLHRDIHVRNRSDGKPEIFFSAPFSELARRVSISLSHGRDYAVAMALFHPLPKK
jgi:holo-[acyl-carrier protein] synthase